MHTKDGVYRTIENDGGNFNVTEYAGTSHLTIQTNHSKKKCVCVRFVSGTAIVSPPFWAFVRQWWRHARAVHNVTEQKMNRQKKNPKQIFDHDIISYILCVEYFVFFFCLLMLAFCAFYFLFSFFMPGPLMYQPTSRTPVSGALSNFLFLICIVCQRQSGSGRVPVGRLDRPMIRFFQSVLLLHSSLFLYLHWVISFHLDFRLIKAFW